jgi:trans-aconitate 2-methyltransferase
MLEQARPLAGDGLRFEKRDIGDFGPGEAVDLVFSNAALHWVPDHASLLPRLAGALAPEGQLAVQVPSNPSQPFQTVALEVAGESPFREALAGRVRQDPVLDPLEYARLLDRLGFREQHVRLQVYTHALASRGAVVDWVRGTALTHYGRLLPKELFEDFVERYGSRLLPLLADTQPFFFPFQRILFWGRR